MGKSEQVFILVGFPKFSAIKRHSKKNARLLERGVCGYASVLRPGGNQCLAQIMYQD